MGLIFSADSPEEIEDKRIAFSKAYDETRFGIFKPNAWDYAKTLKERRELRNKKNHRFVPFYNFLLLWLWCNYPSPLPNH